MPNYVSTLVKWIVAFLIIFLLLMFFLFSFLQKKKEPSRHAGYPQYGFY